MEKRHRNRRPMLCLPTGLLEDRRFLGLSPFARYVWVGLCLLGASRDGRLSSALGEPLPIDEMRRRVGIPPADQEEFAAAVDELVDTGALDIEPESGVMLVRPEAFGWEGVALSARPSSVRERVSRHRAAYAAGREPAAEKPAAETGAAGAPLESFDAARAGSRTGETAAEVGSGLRFEA